MSEPATSTPPAPKKEKRTTRSPDWRLLFCNTISMRIAKNDVMLNFAADVNDDEFLEQVSIVVTPATLKIMAHTYAQAVRVYEQERGEIPVSQKRLKQIEALVDAARPTPKPKT